MFKNCNEMFTFERTSVICEKFTKNFLEPKFLRKIFCEKISRRCYIDRVLTGRRKSAYGRFWECFGGSRDGQIGHAHLRAYPLIFALFADCGVLGCHGRKVGVSWEFWEKNFAKNFFDASPCVSERVVKRDIGWGDFRVRN